MPKTRRTWLLIGLCVALSLAITLLEANNRPSRPEVDAPRAHPAPSAPANPNEVEIEFTDEGPRAP